LSLDPADTGAGGPGEERIKRKRSSLLPSEANKFYNGGLEKEDYSLLFFNWSKKRWMSAQVVTHAFLCISYLRLGLLSASKLNDYMH
jgi:hypothetical protein